MNITPFPDDAGVESLKRTNEGAAVKATEQTTPSAPIPPSERKRERTPEALGVELRAMERRQRERRKKQQPTTLDTRDNHERRHHHDRREGDEEGPPPGIDEIV